LNPSDRLTVREGGMLALKMLGVGVILGPAAFGTLFTAMIYGTAVASGENPISQLMMFPFGWFMAIMLAGVPAAILTAVLISHRIFIGPWTNRRLAFILFPLTWVIAAYSIWRMDGSQALNAEVTSVAVVSGLYYAVLIFCIILFFWALRHRLGLSALGPSARPADAKAVHS
jgi:hypothetical protein